MSHRRRPFGRFLSPGAAFLAAAAIPASAHAESASRGVQYDVPSLKGNIDVKKTIFNKTDKLTAFVRLPAGYDDQPDRRWPVLYLLHGWEDNADAWLDPNKGNINGILPADWPGIVVMPEGARGWNVNWYLNKKYPGERWQDYLFDEVVPAMESKLRILPGRSNHAIGGLSMGGWGALRAVMAMPTYWGHALSFSGLIDVQDVSWNGILNFAQFGGPAYDDIFGPNSKPYAASLSPLKNTRDFRGSRVSITYGTPPIASLLSLDVRKKFEAILEVGAQGHARQFGFALHNYDTAVFEHNRDGGAHSWPSWRLDFADAITRGFFTPPPVTETSQIKVWDYDTMQEHGNAWGFGYQLEKRPANKVTIRRRGDVLSGTGTTGTIRINGGAADSDSTGNGTKVQCSWTFQLPFTKTLPAGC